PVKVTVDGAQVGGFISPSSTSFAPFSVTFSVGTTGPHTIGFTGTDPNDRSTFIDAVTLTSGSSAPPSLLVNSGFEIPAMVSGYQYDPTAGGVGWSFAGSTGIQHNGSAWDGQNAPEGVQTAFVQTTGSMSQTVNL